MVERNVTVSTDAAAAPEKAQITKRCVLRGLMAHALALDAAGRRPALVHVGANLAFRNRNDPVRSLVSEPTMQSLLRVVLVEPQPRVADELRRMTSSMSLVSVVNSAACQSDSPNNVTFYQISAAKVSALKRKPVWFVKNAQISSLSKAHIQKFRRFVDVPINRLIEEIAVPCLSVRSLVASVGVAWRDVVGVIIDTEGHDAQVVAGIDFVESKPSLVVYEKIHMKRDERITTASRLHQQLGYSCSRNIDAENIWCARDHRAGVVKEEYKCL